MKDELSRLQQLLRLIDPPLYRHFEQTNSLNLFICFRWILIGFKREFAFQDVLKVWEAVGCQNCHQVYRSTDKADLYHSVKSIYVTDVDGCLWAPCGFVHCTFNLGKTSRTDHSIPSRIRWGMPSTYFVHLYIPLLMRLSDVVVVRYWNMSMTLPW